MLLKERAMTWYRRTESSSTHLWGETWSFVDVTMGVERAQPGRCEVPATHGKFGSRRRATKYAMDAWLDVQEI